MTRLFHEKHVPEDRQPLFRERDRSSMRFALDLWSYDEVLDHAAEIHARVANGSMPCDMRWPVEYVATLRRWIDEGMVE